MIVTCFITGTKSESGVPSTVSSSHSAIMLPQLTQAVPSGGYFYLEKDGKVTFRSQSGTSERPLLPKEGFLIPQPWGNVISGPDKIEQEKEKERKKREEKKRKLADLGGVKPESPYMRKKRLMEEAKLARGEVIVRKKRGRPRKHFPAPDSVDENAGNAGIPSVTELGGTELSESQLPETSMKKSSQSDENEDSSQTITASVASVNTDCSNSENVGSREQHKHGAMPSQRAVPVQSITADKHSSTSAQNQLTGVISLEKQTPDGATVSSPGNKLMQQKTVEQCELSEVAEANKLRSRRYNTSRTGHLTSCVCQDCPAACERENSTPIKQQQQSPTKTRLAPSVSTNTVTTHAIGSSVASPIAGNAFCLVPAAGRTAAGVPMTPIYVAPDSDLKPPSSLPTMMMIMPRRGEVKPSQYVVAGVKQAMQNKEAGNIPKSTGR